MKELEIYNKKRDFNKTREPQGKTKKGPRDNAVRTKGRLKFVVQHHIASRGHFDLRLEWGGTLLSWAVPKGPSYNPNDRRLAVHVEDHPISYRSFEGTIPKGEYGGGTVMLWDEGTYEPLMDMAEGIKEGHIKFLLNGHRLKGKWVLARTNLAGKAENWLLIKEKDEFGLNEAGIAGFVTSIRTGRTMEEITDGLIKPKKMKNPFNETKVMLAKLEQALPESGKWVYELKYDGYRIVAYLEQNTIKLVSRNGLDYTEKFQDIADSLLFWAGGRPMVLDGEMVIATEGGKTNFGALQNYLKNPQEEGLTYMVFDLLALDGKDLRGETLLVRKERLEQIMKTAPPNLRYSKHTDKIAETDYRAVCADDFEGLIGKRADSVYGGARNGDWIKIKCGNRQEFVVGGYTLSDRHIRAVSSVLLGFYKGNDLIYAGRAGTGFTLDSAKMLEEEFKKIKANVSPFKNAVKNSRTSKNETIIWLKPKLAAEIKFLEWTKSGLLRHPSFLGLRYDKEAKDVIKEEDKAVKEKTIKKEANKKAGKEEKLGQKPASKREEGVIIEGINITNPEKMVFPQQKITKADIARYYQKVSQRMLPFTEGRILSLIRCPDGIAGGCFFKKHPEAKSKEIKIIPFTNSDGGVEEYFYISGAGGLIYQVQMNTLEFHIWGSRADNLEKPDVMIFDLDPDAGLGLKEIRQGVRDLKSLLEELALVCYLKTSGGKGYHIAVPFKPHADWEVFSTFAKKIAVLMEKKWPERYTCNVRKVNRKGRIFIDWIRNTRGATSVAPYSIRAREGASISMPINWSELDAVAPNAITMEECIKRLNKADPWKDFFKTAQKQKLKN